ncbi:MAG: hypothetical protein Q8M56_09960 [Desulfobacterales bacterium]|nr:hypothetical protein [Desulfobacterales bacterium]
MSRHAREQWVARVGGDPPRDIAPLLEECVIMQQCRDYYTSRGRACRVLALYWHPDREIMFKVDTKHNVVVTVVTKKTLSCESRYVI